MKIIKFTLITLVCAMFALVPEIAMYFTWGLINPSSEAARIAVLALFWFVGGGLCVLFAYFGVFAWLLGLQKL